MLRKTILALISLIFTVPLIAADLATTTVPLQVVPISANDYRVGVNVSVAGGPPSLVTFDTGGSGLHIFASQVGNANIQYTNQHVRSVFGSGQHRFSFEGVIAYAPVTIGNVTSKPIPILVIESMKCHNGPCKVATGNGAPPMFGQFYGEMGVGMLPENDPASSIKLMSPLVQMPGNYSSGFIIQNLNPNSTAGELILGLTPQNIVGFNLVQLPKFGIGPNGEELYNDKALKVQYQIGNITETLRTAFDTGGNYQVNLFSPPIPGLPLNRNNVVHPGLNFDASLENAFDWNFMTTNRNGGGAVVLLAPPAAKGTYVNTGIGFFFNHNVLYDYTNGQLGFMPQD